MISMVYLTNSFTAYHLGTFSIQQFEYMHSSTRWILFRWLVGEPEGQFGIRERLTIC